MKTPFIGAMDSLVQCCKSDLTTTKPWTREWGWLELTHPECLPHYPPSIRPAVITEPVSQHTAEQYFPQSHSKSSSSIETEIRRYIEPNSWSRTIPAQPRWWAHLWVDMGGLLGLWSPLNQSTVLLALIAVWFNTLWEAWKMKCWWLGFLNTIKSCLCMLGKSTKYSTGTRPLCSIFWAK